MWKLSYRNILWNTKEKKVMWIIKKSSSSILVFHPMHWLLLFLILLLFPGNADSDGGIEMMLPFPVCSSQTDQGLRELQSLEFGAIHTEGRDPISGTIICCILGAKPADCCISSEFRTMKLSIRMQEEYPLTDNIIWLTNVKQNYPLH